MPDGSSVIAGLQTRQPPMNIQAEEALLGAILANNKAYHRVSEFLAEEHFADPINGRIYRAAQLRIEEGKLADAVTLKADFEHTGILNEVGGTEYLARLLTAMVGIINAPDYARAVYEAWARRQLIDIGESVVNLAYDGSQAVADTATEFATTLDKLTIGREMRKPTALGDAMRQALEKSEAAAKGEGRSGVTTGSQQLDDLFGDLEAGGVYILAGRPGDGKSALALQIADHNARNGVPVHYSSTEMQAAQLGRRALALNTGISAKAIKRGDLSDFDRRKLWEAQVQFGKLKDLFLIEDAPGLNTRIIGSASRSFVRKHRNQTGLIVIDHMHDLGEFSEADMIKAVGTICRGVKLIAKQTNWPVLLLAQMNRAKDNRDSKRPEMSDLYGGMHIEAVAEGITMLDRPERRLDPFPPEKKSSETDDKYQDRYLQWQTEWNKWRGKTLGYVPKVRDGETGVATWDFDGPSNRFTDAQPVQGI